MSGLGKRLVEGPLTSAGLAVGHFLLLGIGGTWRVRYTGREHVTRARGDGGAVFYAISHGVLLPLAYAHRGRSTQILVSESRDGELITRVIRRLGFGVVRGSTSRGGGRGAVRLAELGRAGYDLGITPDGPRGPRGSVAPGVAAVAARSGLPIVPIGVGADRAWRLNSWDRFLIPKPGALVVVHYEDAIRVERGDETAAIEAVRAGLARAEERAEERLTRPATRRDASRIPA